MDGVYCMPQTGPLANGLIAAAKSIVKVAFYFFDNMTNMAINVLTCNSSSNLTGTLDSAWDLVIAISDVLKPFCYTIIGICLLIELAQVASKVDIIKWEHGLKLAVKMVLSKVCIDVAPKFLQACYEQATDWITDLSMMGTSSSIGTDLYETMGNAIDSVDTSLAQAFVLMLMSLPMYLFIAFTGLVIVVIAYARIFEIFVYVAISPLPCAFFPMGDGSGGGIARITSKFFKNFIAVCLQGVMMLVCLRVFTAILTTAVDNMVANPSGGTAWGTITNLGMAMILGGLVMLISIIRCGSWAKSIMDAA